MIKFKKNKIEVTEHAILRYAQRVMGLDPHVVAKLIVKQIDISGAKNYNGTFKARLNKDTRAVIRDNIVVTVERIK